MQETESNYNTHWWALIYDQWNESGGRSALNERELYFYRNQLQNTQGAILEAACGSGCKMLPLLQDGFDIYGFDISLPMLDVLRRKAMDFKISDIDSRITQQDLADFNYDQSFEAILIPASSFMMLPTQQSQIACLRRVYECLQPGGRLLLNFYIPSYTEDLLRHQSNPPIEEDFGECSHPETGRPIQVNFSKVCDLATQTETYNWTFEYDGEKAEVPMKARWIHKEEFQLLLQLSGFNQWELYGSHDEKPYVGSPEVTNTYWNVVK